MIRKIIHIDENRCVGCGICANACHEGAIEMINGKARLVREDFCDGFGDCLPSCPAGAITFEEREAPAYDKAAVMKEKKEKEREKNSATKQARNPLSRLEQWPCQIKLLPVKAPFYEGGKLFIAADCTAYAYANLHEDFMKGRITLIGCPKLDDIDYTNKLAEIITENDIKDIMLARMEVPCCGGLQRAVENALHISKKEIPLQIVTITRDGRILE